MSELVANKDKHQWFTPVWAAELLISRFFPELDERDMVLDPTAGTGNFLKALPSNIPCYGVEIDPSLVDIAFEECSRPVLQGDFTAIDLPWNPTAIIGNPPFSLDVIDQILEKCHAVLPKDGKAGFILPTYAFQTASRVSNYSRVWSLHQEMIPRNLFKGMQKSLCFAIFKKDGLRMMSGFALYQELHDVNSMNKDNVRTLSTQTTPWKEIVMKTLLKLGGKATLSDLYNAIEPIRPTGNNWWKEKIRQTLGRSGAFQRVGESIWAISPSTAAA